MFFLYPYIWNSNSNHTPKGEKAMRKKITVFLSLLSVFVLVFSISLADTSFTINAPITSANDYTASQWYSTSRARAALTVFITLDVIPQMDGIESVADTYTSIWEHPSWVGLSKSKNQVMVAEYFSDKISTTILVCIYTPSTGKIEYMPIISKPAIPDTTAELLCSAAIQNNNTSTYEKNDNKEVLSVVEDLVNKLNK